MPARSLQFHQTVLDNMAEGVSLATEAGVIVYANPAEDRMFGYEGSGLIGKTFTDLGVCQSGDFMAVLRDKGVWAGEWCNRRSSGESFLTRARITLVGIDGAPHLMRVQEDITQERAAQRALAESETRLALATRVASLGVWDWDLTSNIITHSDQAKAIYGFEPDEVVTLEMVSAATHPDDLPHTRSQASRALDPAIRDVSSYEYRVIRRDGEVRWVLAHGQVVFETRDGVETPVRYVGAIQDITDRKVSRQTLEQHDLILREETRALGVINRAGAAIASDLNLERLVQTVTDAGVELTGAEFGAFFYNVTNHEGESYTLYSLSGAPREAFAKFPMPRNTAIFGPTFQGDRIVRSDDILTDPNYGLSAPYYGMPKGHLPVRSYLAVPVRSRNGEVIGGLFFGHGQPGRFTERSESLLAGLAGQAAVAIDNVRLFGNAEREVFQRRTAEAKLQELNATLERRIADEVRERARAEEALRQAQKMEAIGQLTGGVAHDFNNLLTVIIGGLDTILRLGPNDRGRIERAANMALQGAQRAAGLTTRLLAFSRRQPLEPKPADINELVGGMTDLLRRTLGETIDLHTIPGAGLWTVEVDQHQLESAILNLALNARDAMPEGGRLTLETANVEVTESDGAEIGHGCYVAIAIGDTGEGMSAEVLSRVFEPFFTTKEVGKGTGLGLSMVYGFVKQSGGHVTVESEPGRGTTVRLSFPRSLGEIQPARPHLGATPIGQASEVVLVVEDNDEVRQYSVMMLEELGYGVVAACDADAAMTVLKGDRQIDLLFTDVVLPGVSGRVVAEQAKALRPQLPVLFTTGYSRDAIVHHGRLDEGVELLAKPFTYEQLARRVRQVLDAMAMAKA